MASDVSAQSEKPIEQQAAEQTGQQVQLRIDEQKMQSCYANAFRSNGLAEEVVVDFGFNIPTGGNPPQILFQVANRVVLNYYSAKRLAITLGQIVRQHESQFGELELDVAKRRKN